MLKRMLITWVVVAVLVFTLLWFGYSDIRDPEIMCELTDKDLMRPLWRLAFGWTMAALVMATGAYLTRLFFYRSPD